MHHLSVQELLVLLDGGGAHGRFGPCRLLLISLQGQSRNWRVILCAYFLDLTTPGTRRQVLVRIVILQRLLFINLLQLSNLISKALNFIHLTLSLMRTERCRVRIGRNIRL